MRCLWFQAVGWGEREQGWWGQWPSPGFSQFTPPHGGLLPPPPPPAGPSVTGDSGQEEKADGTAARAGARERPESSEFFQEQEANRERSQTLGQLSFVVILG